jgi:FkbM family methyltransferase
MQAFLDEWRRGPVVRRVTLADVKRPNLIIDVGMHAGEDTEHYLAEGFDVVAIEANPALVAEVTERHAEAVSAGRLRIISAAIAEDAGTRQLAVSDEITIWSSLSDDFVRRNEAVGATYRYVEVPAMRFQDVLEDVGVPYYLKIDIEGLDMLCVKALHEVDERPDYISLESSVTATGNPFADAFDELAHLWTLGYRSFKYVNQNVHRKIDPSFSPDGSGPFAERTRGPWRGIEHALVQAEALRRSHRIGGFGGARQSVPARAIAKFRRDVLGMGHYDLHARLADPDRRGGRA